MQDDNVILNEEETALALHALRFYMNAKGNELSANTKALESKLAHALDGQLRVSQFAQDLADLFAAVKSNNIEEV